MHIITSDRRITVADRDAAFRTATREAAASRARVYGDATTDDAVAHSRAVFTARYAEILGL